MKGDLGGVAEPMVPESVELTAEAVALTRDEFVWLWGWRHVFQDGRMSPKLAECSEMADKLLADFRERFPQEAKEGL